MEKWCHLWWRYKNSAHQKVTIKLLKNTPALGKDLHLSTYSLRSTQIEDLTLKKWSKLNSVPCMIRLKSLHKNLQKAWPFIRITGTYKGRRPIKGNHKQQRKKKSLPHLKKISSNVETYLFVSRNLPLYPKIGGIKIFDYLWRVLAS